MHPRSAFRYSLSLLGNILHVKRLKSGCRFRLFNLLLRLFDLLLRLFNLLLLLFLFGSGSGACSLG
jgi:hypothetical protein